MPPPLIAIIADDLTGAADTAAAFARPGRAVPVSLNEHPVLFEDALAFAVTTESRSSSAKEAYECVAAAATDALKASPTLVYKKVDSNLRGNIGAELAALRDVATRPIVLAPAFPVRGRTTVDGVALLDGVPVAETEMGTDPEAPVRISDIAELIHSQRPGIRVVRLAREDIRRNPESLPAAFSDSEVVVADAETDADLESIAGAALSVSPPPVLAGSAGLAAVLALRLLDEPRSAPEPVVREPDPVSEVSGERPATPVFGLLASSSQRLMSQLARLAEAGTEVIPVPCQDLSREEAPLPDLNEAIARAAAEIQCGRDAIVHAAGPLPAVERPVDLVVEHLAHLAFVVVKRAAPAAILVGGGATAHAVLTALRTTAVRVDQEPLPGIAAGVAIGGVLSGRPLVLKPGAAGGEQALTDLVRYLKRRGAKEERT